MGKKQSKVIKMNTEQQFVNIEAEEVSCVATSKENVFTASGTDGIIHGFDKNSRKEVERCSLHIDDITKIEVDESRDAVFTASRDKTVNRMTKDAAHHKYNGHSLVVTSLSLKNDGTQIVSGSRDCCVKLWDVEKAIALRSEIIPRNLVTDLKWSSTENFFVQCSEDKVMKLWDSTSLRNTFTFPMKQYFQTCCDLNDVSIATGSTGGNGNGCEVEIYDIRQLKSIHCLKGHTQKVSACKFMNSDLTQNSLVTIGHDCVLRLWNVVTGECHAKEVIDGAKQLTSLAIDNYNNRVYVGTFQLGVHVYKVEENNTLTSDGYFFMTENQMLINRR